MHKVNKNYKWFCWVYNFRAHIDKLVLIHLMLQNVFYNIVHVSVNVCLKTTQKRRRTQEKLNGQKYAS